MPTPTRRNTFLEREHDMQSQAYGNLDTTQTLNLQNTTLFIQDHGLDVAKFVREVKPDNGEFYSVGLIESWLGY